MADPVWLEISLTVDGEMAEAVAEVLTRYVEGGVVLESNAMSVNADGEDSLSGQIRVYGYLPVDANLDEKRSSIEEALWYMGRIRPLPVTRYRTIQEKDWSQAWKEHYHPISVSQRLIIVPAWIENPDPARIPIKIDPGMAFGTGTHPSTQLCLQVIDSWFQIALPDSLSDPGGIMPASSSTVIDIGCGSGILSIAALKLGAPFALGVDVDPQAIDSARKNATLNGVADRLELGLGSVADIRAGAYSLQTTPLVVANILAPVIIQLLDEGLADLLTNGSMLVLSGILKEQTEDVILAVRKQNLYVVMHRQIKDWVALGVQRSASVT